MMKFGLFVDCVLLNVYLKSDALQIIICNYLFINYCYYLTILSKIINKHQFVDITFIYLFVLFYIFSFFFTILKCYFDHYYCYYFILFFYDFI